jgi:thiol-disulfide isomerase/thioredoxin
MAMVLTKKIIILSLIFSLLYTYKVSAQDFELNNSITTTSGKVLNSEYFKDKIILTNFWFIGCYPCMKEIPDLNKIAVDFKDKVTFVAINKGNSTAQIEYFIKKFPFLYTQTMAKQDLLDSLKINLYPTNILYNKKGEVVFKSEGYDINTITSLRKAIEEIIKN